jgi:hypothetical protein
MQKRVNIAVAMYAIILKIIVLAAFFIFMLHQTFLLTYDIF